MSEPIITVENLGKRYVLGHQRSKEDGFRHVIEGALRAPLKWLRSRRERKKPEREDFWALKDISFNVQQGEVVGIIGRNGAGKSTLLKVLSRITEPTAGRININGRVASLLEVGTGFHPDLTGRENIFLNGAILGMSRAEIRRKFDEIVAFSEVEKFLDTPVKRYSSGMYVRLAFAVAAHLEPEILVVDEVLAVGDAQFQKKCLGKMGEVAKGGRTVLFVSHNMLAVQQLCARCLLFEHGRLRAGGAVQEIVEQYLTKDVSDSFEGPADPHLPRIVSARILTTARLTNVPIEILVEWDLPKAFPGIKVGLGVCTPEGQTVFDSAPEDTGETTPSEQGVHRRIFRIPPNTLMALNYSIAIGLWRDSTSFHHVLPAMSMVIEPAPTGPYAHQSTRAGLVNITCSWLPTP
jgi:lipopolysaccharide transport system ATP-binding protein